jgi:hypothetical protein
MQSLISSLMTAVLLVHALLGCCRHHAHACVIEAAQVSVACASHEGHSHGAPEGSDQHDGHQHECGGNACVFVRAEGPQIAALAASWAIDPACTRQAGQFTAGLVRSTTRTDPHEFAGSVRLHLLHQILLI